MEPGGFLYDVSAFHADVLFMGNSPSNHRGGATTMISMEESSKRRPLLSSRDDIFDEDQFQEKKRHLTPEQVTLLEKNFDEENKLEPERKTQLAKRLSLQPRQVAVWFQNRRARWKTKQLEGEYHLLKSSFDSLFSNYDPAVEDNKRLRSEVVFKLPQRVPRLSTIGRLQTSGNYGQIYFEDEFAAAKQGNDWWAWS